MGLGNNGYGQLGIGVPPTSNVVSVTTTAAPTPTSITKPPLEIRGFESLKAHHRRTCIIARFFAFYGVAAGYEAIISYRILTSHFRRKEQKSATNSD
jgi:hypothetical protein